MRALAPAALTPSVLVLAASALLALPMLAGGAAAQTTDPSFRLNNNAPADISEVYVSASGGGWGADRLGKKVLASGQTHIVRLPDGQCTNDVRVVFSTGDAQEKRRVNTCALTDMAFP